MTNYTIDKKNSCTSNNEDLDNLCEKLLKILYEDLDDISNNGLNARQMH